MPVLDRLFSAGYDDMRRMESLLAGSDREWFALRPPRLLEKPGTESYRIDHKPLPRTRSLTYADLATALLDVATGEPPSERGLYIAN